MKPYVPALALTLLALSGCKQEVKPSKATGGTAAGEILPGSVSDAMVPVDSLRSQPPAAPKSDAGPADKASSKPGVATAPAAAAAPAAEAPEPADPAPPEG